MAKRRRRGLRGTSMTKGDTKRAKWTLGGLGRPGDRLTLKQVRKLREQLDRNGQSDIAAGACRKVAQGVEICRNTRGEYRVTSTRDSREYRR